MGDVRDQSMTSGNLPRGSIFAVLLILGGTLLFLDNIGVLPIPDLHDDWPLFIVLWGLFMLLRWRSAVSVIWGLALMAWGVLLILGNLHVLPVTGSVFWAIAFIAGGVTMLVRPAAFREWQEKMRASHMEARERQERRRADFRDWREKRRAGIHAWQERPPSPYAGFTGTFSMGAPFFGNRLRETAVFGSLNRRVPAQHFEGGKVEAVFGSVEIDLTEATISSPDHTALLEANAVFGGIEISVPRNWKVVMRAAAVLGGCDDRSIPPRPEPGVETPTLVVTGAAVFGGIEIRN